MCKVGDHGSPWTDLGYKPWPIVTHAGWVGKVVEGPCHMAICPSLSTWRSHRGGGAARGHAPPPGRRVLGHVRDMYRAIPPSVSALVKCRMSRQNMWRGGGALRSDGFYAVMPLQARASTAFTAPLTEPITLLYE